MNTNKPEDADEIWPVMVIPEQDRTEVYANDNGQIVIKQEGLYREEQVIIIQPVFLEQFISHLRATKKFISKLS